MLEADANINRIIKNLRKAYQRGLRHSGRIMKDEIKRLIKDPPKSGIKYRHLPNRSSAKGEAPANQTGFLMNSVEFAVKGTDLEVGDTAFYGGFLEFYHKRPHVSTAASTKQATMNLLINNYINKEILV